MEQQQLASSETKDDPRTVQSHDETRNTDPTVLIEPAPGDRRSSTPNPSDEETNREANLSALESALRVFLTCGSQLPELRNLTSSDHVNFSDPQSRTDGDDVSSVCDEPALPGGGPKVQFLVGQSEEDESMEETSQIVPVELYGHPPFVTESSTEGGDESCSESQVPGPSARTEQSNIPHHSGRSRAILKEYFDEAIPVRFPVGHDIIALTEPQMYHLLRVLTDETLRRSFTTMERMVIDAVRGSPNCPSGSHCPLPNQGTVSNSHA